MIHAGARKTLKFLGFASVTLVEFRDCARNLQSKGFVWRKLATPNTSEVLLNAVHSLLQRY